MSPNPKVIKMLLSQILQLFYVRDHLNQDRVEQLSKLYEAGVDLPPIIVAEEDGKYILVAGRHRIKARELGGHKDVPAEIRKYENRTAMILDAFKENISGPLPPTESDIRHTLELLLEQGLSRKTIIERLTLETAYPAAVLRQYMDAVQSAIAARKLNKAITDITENGSTVDQAAEKHKLDPAKIKIALRGKNKKKGSEEDLMGVGEIKSGMSSRYKAHGHKNSALLRKLMHRVEEGNLSKKDVLAILKHFDHLTKREAAYIKNGGDRLKAAIESK